MKATLQLEPPSTAQNIISLAIQPKPKATGPRQRFRIVNFKNGRTGSISYRVTGWTREGKRIRENFADQQAAECRQVELANEWLERHTDTVTRPTNLNGDQLRLAEAAVIQLGDDWQRMIDAVTYWQQNGKQRANIESPWMDDAIEKYLVWLKASPFRDDTKRHWRIRMNMFRNGTPRIRVVDASTEVIHAYLSERKVSESGRDTDRRAISRFFSWCIERPRKWVTINPCRNLPRTQKGEAAPIRVFTLKESKDMFKAAVREKLVRYTVLCTIGGLRPTEAKRVATKPESINLKDREIRLESNQTKTGRKTRRGRVVHICDTLYTWLKAYEDEPIYPANWRKRFDKVKRAAGFTGRKDASGKQLKPWPLDVMRHTAISHYFRKASSYGQTAEQFGTSEAIIKNHYQGCVTSEDTKKFYGIKPEKGRRQK